ncbi:GNAT family N-acetyltransferase [Pseudonocardia spinosispora]|uniref:GNAT family N-acetyltransferase n=1 Tax=Pseudonocardia spinosispora TaxID=103441 RepID=UPI00041443A4|nr:GNAT family N-acetyltransferase [Pseudonocardia spinosispora]
MEHIEVRPFRRDDRDQLTALVNAHVQAVIPGASVSVNTVLSRLEREPGEYVVDPWVDERVTLVAHERGRVVAAAHLVRYGTGSEVGESYRNFGEIRWLVCWPDAVEAGDAMADAAKAVFRRFGVRRVVADGALPAPGIVGVPEQWLHVRGVLDRAGFVSKGTTEIVLLADVGLLAVPEPPLADLTSVRAVGTRGTRFEALHAERSIGFLEIDSCEGDLGLVVQRRGWAQVATLKVDDAYRDRGIDTWLLGQAAVWLRLGQIDRLLDYATPDEHDYLHFLERAGFHRLTTTIRDWQHPTAP